MFTSAVEKYIKTVTTFCNSTELNLSKILFFATNSNADAAILKDICNLARNARHPRNGFCLIWFLAACTWVRIIRVRVRPLYESFTLWVSGQVPRQQSSFRRIRRKVTFLSGMPQRGRVLISNTLFHGGKKSYDF